MAETLKLPTEVVDLDWKSIGDYETFGTPKEEREYISPKEISDESIEKIKSIDLRHRFAERGKKVSKLFDLNKTIA